MMAAAVSVNVAAREENSSVGPNFTAHQLYGHCDAAAEHGEWASMAGSEPDGEPGDEEASTGEEGHRRVDEELSVLSPSEIEKRLERTRREFYNRRKIIIKNLPADISNQEVHELLSDYDLKYCFVDKYKGTAFVTLLNGEQAQSAIQQFHQRPLRERDISVQLQPTDALLCIANLPPSFTQQQFEELVRPFGNLERCFLVYSASSGHSKGYGFVEYMKKDSAARAKSELLGKQLGARMLYVHWTEVGSVTYALLHSRCLCLDRLPSGLLHGQHLSQALSLAYAPLFCQLAQGQDGSFHRFAVLEFATAEMAEEVQRATDGRALGGTNIRVSFCAPGPPGRSMLAALIAAQTMGLNRGKGLLPEPSALQILSSLNNPATLRMLLNPLAQGRKQGILGAAAALPLLANPALSAALLQLLLQNQAQMQQAGLLGETPITALPLQQGGAMMPDLSPGGVIPDTPGPIRPPAMGHTLLRESPTAPPLLGGMLGGEGPATPGVSILGELPRVGTPPLAAHGLFSGHPSGGNCRPHPYRKKPLPGSMTSHRPARSLQCHEPQYLPVHQDGRSHLFEAQEDLDPNLLGGFGQHLHQPSYAFPLNPPLSTYYSSSAVAAPSAQLNKAVGMPPMSPASSLYSSAPGAAIKTPVGGQKRLFSRLIPSPEPSPEGGYVGQHSQGLGGHYADSYMKRKRIF
ncbi:ribonucleoprotein PTB-binding 1 isoform X2 [Conger conger]|uniref:ribonucleoprotein PTB-binding 1 isoform X2 n=1 Tax=Conger conger TaxID=82655 RepID=UPI002A59F136|nr:ribonucleoprotein PTB-binding 1 isoform X2 [Conger conger]